MADLRGQPWLESSFSRAVMAALEVVGGPDCARFVGGCVRNALLDAPVDDIDIATRLEPHKVVRALKAAGIRVVPTGIEHGTVTAIVEGRPFEITTLRRDVETDGRRAVVAFTEDWAEDAARRDFRLNALYASGDGTIHDPTGAGVDDARAGRIVFVGEPEQRIREDYLRILRFYRFQAWYGRGEPDAAGQEACTRLVAGLTTLSAERVSKEILKLLAARDPVASVTAMAAAGGLARVLPQASLERFAPMVRLTGDSLLRLASLLPQDRQVMGQTARALRLSNAQRDRLVAAAVPLDPPLSDVAARGLIWDGGAQAFSDRVLLAWAAGAQATRCGELLEIASSWQPPVMPVGGRDIARRGIGPGPETGRILEAFRQSWMEADFPDHGHEERLDAIMAAGDQTG